MMRVMKQIPLLVAAALLLAGCATLRMTLQPHPHRKLPPPPPELVSISRRDYDAMADAVRAQTDADITFVSKKPDGSVDVYTARRFWYRPASKVKYTVRKTRGGWQVISKKPWF
jgi:hypothetical protein